jgi:CheY-like chemotaxis protein
MTITKALVEQMQGDIDLDTEPGRGTCIIVTLPLDEVDAATTVPQEPPRASRPGRPGRPAGRAVDPCRRRQRGQPQGPGADAGTRRRPRDHGRGGRGRARALGAGAVRLVLLDISMPDLDGFSTLAALRAKAADLGAPAPVALAITANVMTHQVDEYFRAGFAGHVGKPFQSARLIEEISRALRPASAAGPAGCPARRQSKVA